MARYCLDEVVTLFGATVEGALNERVNTGTEEKPKWESKYTLTQLLDPSFRMPRALPEKYKPPANGIAALKLMAGRAGSGVKLWTGTE